jgi:cobalt/nickel transport system permease protein
MSNGIPAFLYQENKSEISSSNIRKSSLPFIDKTLKAVANTLKAMYMQSQAGSETSLFYRINPLVKVFSFVYFIVAISLANNITAQLIAFLFVAVFYLVSGVSYKYIYKKILFLSLVFGLLIFLPASLNLITSGKIVLKIITLQRSYHFWIYNIPQTIGITDTGLQTVVLLFLRVMNSISLALLFVYSSSFSQIIKGFKVFWVPDTFLMIVSLAYKYIFILAKTIEETYFALKSRLIGSVKSDSIRKIISGRVFFIFNKSKTNYEATYSAMISRGYDGKIKLFQEKKIKPFDFIFLLFTVSAGLLIVFIEVLWKILSV